MSRRGTTVIVALLLAIAGAALSTAPADARPYRHYYHHHRGWYGPGFGPGFVYRSYPRCWTEWRNVRVHTRYGVVWRERPVRRCR